MNVYRSMSMTISLLLASVLLIGSGAFIAFASLSSDWPVNLVTAVVGVSAAGLGVWRLLAYLPGKNPLILVTQEGLRAVRVSSRMIPWPAVSDVRRVQVRGQEFLTFDLEEGFAREFEAGGVRMTHFVGHQLGFHGVYLSTAGLGVSTDELYDAIVRHWRPAPT